MHSKIFVITSPTGNNKLDVYDVLYPYSYDLSVPEHIYKTKEEWYKKEVDKMITINLVLMKNIEEKEEELVLTRYENEMKENLITLKKSVIKKNNEILSEGYNRIKAELIKEGYSFDEKDNIISWNNDIDGKYDAYEIGGKYENSINRVDDDGIKRCTTCSLRRVSFNEISNDDTNHIPISEEAKALPRAIVSKELGWYDIKGKDRKEVIREVKDVLRKNQSYEQNISVVDIYIVQ